MNLTSWWHLFALLALEAGVVVALAALIAWRSKSAVWQRTVWQTAVLVLLALPVCELTGAARGLWRWTGAEEPSRTKRSFVVRTFPPALNAAKPDTVLADPAAASIEKTPTKAVSQRAVWWPGLVWLVGTSLLLARFGLARAWFLFRWQRCSVRDEACLARVRFLTGQLGVRRPVRVTAAPRLSGPIAFGLLRPTICLPESFATDFTAPQQEAMLAHELAHLAARDPGWYVLAGMMTALWWWLPLAWWSRRQLQAAAERAADDASLLIDDGPSALAECLVMMGRRLTRKQASGGIGIEGNGFRSTLGRRVARLLASSGSPWRGLARVNFWPARAAGVVTLAAVLCSGAAWTSANDAPQPLAQLAWEAVAHADKELLLAQAQSKAAPRRAVEEAGAPVALHTRTFKVDPNTMIQALTKATPETLTAPPLSRTNNPSTEELNMRLIGFLGSFGFDLRPPKALYFNDRNGLLMVRATETDFDLIEQAIQVINSAPPQVTIEVKFVELTADDSRALGFDWWLNSNGVVTTTTTRPAPLTGKNFDEPRLQSPTNLPPAPMTGILTAPQFRVMLAALEKRRGTDILSAPKVTTLSGRPAQIKVVDVRYVVTDLDTSEKDKIQPIAEPFEFGPVLDVVPHVSADGYSIQMTIIPSVKEFLGYDTNQFQAQIGTATQIVPLPIFRFRQVVATATALDGQTVLVSPGTVLAEEKPDPANPGTRTKVRKNLLIFITPTIIDPAGNRVHSEEEMLQRSNSVPPQKTAR